MTNRRIERSGQELDPATTPPREGLRETRLSAAFQSVKLWYYLSGVMLVVLASLVACSFYRQHRIERLVQDLKSPEPEAARAAAQSLKGTGPDVIDYLLPKIKNMDSQARAHAAAALRDVPEALPPLVEGLDVGNDPEMRAASAEVLGRIGPSAKDSVPALIAALQDTHGDVRGKAKMALGEIKDPRAIEPLIKTFDRDPPSDNSATVALGKIGAVAIPFLTRRLNEGPGKVRELSAAALGEVGTAAMGSDAVPSLIALLNEKEPDGARGRAVWALGKIKDARAVRPLINMLTKRVPPEDIIIEALGELGPAAKKAMPLLETWSWDADERLHRYAIEARKKIAPESMDEITRDEQDYARSEDAITSVTLLPPKPGEILTGGDGYPTKFTLTFRWELANRKPGVGFCSTLLIDKGENPFDGRAGLMFAGAGNPPLTSVLNYGEYYASTFECGVEITACRDAKAACAKPGSCVGRKFRSNIEKYTGGN